MLHHAVEGPVADDRMSSFPPACCCWQGSCREGLRRWGGRRGGRGPVGARSRPCGAAQQSCACSGPLPRAGAQLPVDCFLLLGGVAGAAAAGLRRMLRGDDDVFYLFLQKQKIGAELHIYLEEGTYHKRLFKGPNTNDMKKLCSLMRS